MNNLIHKDHRAKFADTVSDEEGIKEMFQFIYWKTGATDIETGKENADAKAV